MLYVYLKYIITAAILYKDTRKSIPHLLSSPEPKAHLVSLKDR